MDRWRFLAVAGLLLVQSASAPATAQESNRANSVPLPANARVTVDGSISFAKKPAAPKPVTAGPRITSDSFIVPEIRQVKKTNLDHQGIEKLLNVLFDNWPAAGSTYAPYFLMLPGTLDLKGQGVTANLTNEAPNTLYLYKPYQLDQASVGITLMIPQQITTAQIFKPANSGAPYPSDAIFVRLDPFGSQVPTNMAAIFEADFIHGLVTRLVLDQYVAFWKQLPGSTINVSLGIGLGQSPSGVAFAPFSDPASYPDNSTLAADLKTLMQTGSLNPVGIVLGWQAASDLIAADTDSRKPLTHAIWQLINSRYSMLDIGRITAFTLQYFSGYTLNERILAIASGNGTVPNKITDAGGIAGELAANGQYNTSKHFLTDLSRILLAEYYAAGQNRYIQTSQKRILLTQYYYFIKGFQSGLISGADAIISEIGNVDYDAGYDQGFKDGYSAGYAAGWAAGYATGYQTAWAQANTTISQLQSTISSLQGELSSAEQGSTDNGGFWGTVGSVASTVGTVIGAIGSFF